MLNFNLQPFINVTEISSGTEPKKKEENKMDRQSKQGPKRMRRTFLNSVHSSPSSIVSHVSLTLTSRHWIFIQIAGGCIHSILVFVILCKIVMETHE